MPACRDKESGFALLVILLMAAVLAISLYSEIPRVAFQSQRHKEQLLMDRGEQYQRGIQVFYVTTRQYPSKMDDLVEYNGRHFLRHKFVDPMTGKDDWRIIHVQGNVVVDSIRSTQAPAGQQAGQQASDPGTYISANVGVGQTAEGEQSPRPQDRRRASEGGSGDQGALPFPTDTPADTGASATQLDSGQQSTSGTPGSQPGSSVQALLGITGQPVTLPGASGSMSGPASGIGGQPGMPGMPGMPGAPGLPGASSSAMPGGLGGVNPAAGLINDLLTRPNPQGALIVQQALLSQSGPGGSIIGAGGLIYASPSNAQGQGGMGLGGSSSGGAGLGSVAGVASASKQQSIMVYNDHTAYNEWEFIFDPAKVAPITPPTGGATAAGASGANQVGLSGTPTGTGPGAPGGVGARGDSMFGSSQAGGGFGGGFGGAPQGGMGLGGTSQGGITPGGTSPGSTGQGGTTQPAASGAQSGNLPSIRMGRP